MKGHLWKCSKINLTGGYAGAMNDDKPSVLPQVRNQSQVVGVRGF